MINISYYIYSIDSDSKFLISDDISVKLLFPTFLLYYGDYIIIIC